MRREAKRHAAFGSRATLGKRCRRCALPPQSKSLPPLRGVAGFSRMSLASPRGGGICDSRAPALALVLSVSIRVYPWFGFVSDFGFRVSDFQLCLAVPICS